MKAPISPRVTWPVMYHHWSRLTFLHWRYPQEFVQSLLPRSLTVETCEGAAWIGLVPFLMEGVRVPGLPWSSRFPETNVRTYVRDARGRSGVWFMSLDAGSLHAALGGRGTFGLPYFWSDMSMRTSSERWEYRSRRHWPKGARCDADVRPGAALEEGECDELAHFLTARYRLFTTVAGRLATAEIEHPAWPLHSGELIRLEENLLAAGGVPAPDHAPVVHTSPGVPVRIGMWSW